MSERCNIVQPTVHNSTGKPTLQRVGLSLDAREVDDYYSLRLRVTNKGRAKRGFNAALQGALGYATPIGADPWDGPDLHPATSRLTWRDGATTPWHNQGDRLVWLNRREFAHAEVLRVHGSRSVSLPIPRVCQDWSEEFWNEALVPTSRLLLRLGVWDSSGNKNRHIGVAVKTEGHPTERGVSSGAALTAWLMPDEPALWADWAVGSYFKGPRLSA